MRPCHPHSTHGNLMVNISYVDFVVPNEPVEVTETWSKSMFILMFLGGFWCGAATFIMLLAIHTHLELGWVRRQRRPVIETSPFWADWRSEGSRRSRRGWSVHSDDTESGGSSGDGSMYEEVQVRGPEVEYTEVAEWTSDSSAIHYWRPFDEPSTVKTNHQTWRGKCDRIYGMIRRDPDHAGQV